MKRDRPASSDLVSTSAAEDAVLRSWALIRDSRREIVANRDLIEEGQRALKRSRMALGRDKAAKGSRPTTTPDSCRALSSAVVDLDELPHPRHAGRVLTAAAAEGKGCSDDAETRGASTPVAVARDGLPSMLDRSLHVPAPLTARTNRHPPGTTDTGSKVRNSG